MISLAPLRDCRTNRSGSLALMLAALTSVSVAGCAMGFGNVNPVGGGVYTAGAMSSYGLCEPCAKEKALNKAEEYCADQGKQMSFLNMKKASDPYGVYISVRFKCE